MPGGDSKFKCPKCGKEFQHQRNVQRHISEVHGVKKFNCDKCDKGFARKEKLIIHKQRHAPKAEHICNVCRKTYKEKKHLQRHYLLHKSTVFSCATCDQHFTRKDTLTRHEKKHQADAPLHICRKCSKSFSRADMLFHHLKVCVAHSERQSRPKLRQQICTRQVSKDSLQCPVCQAIFTVKNNLHRHMTLHQQVRKRYSCDKCEKSWTRASRLHNHICTNPEKVTNTSKNSDRVKKHRLLKKHKANLPSAPADKATLVESLIATPSKKTRNILQNKGLIQSSSKQDEDLMGRAMLADAGVVLSAMKAKRSTGASQVRQKVAAIIVGDNVKKSKKCTNVSRKLSMFKTVKKVKENKTRVRLIKGEEAAFVDVGRKTRCLKIQSEIKSKMTQFWIEEASHPTTDTTRNKVRKKIAAKKYLIHNRHVCLKSYREVFDDFISKNPDVKVSESTFRRCKPYFVRPATQRDLELCCCQVCVTVRKAFRALMNYRKQKHIEPIFADVHEMVKSTLCPKREGQEYNDLKCLKQECPKCGLKLLQIHELETTDNSMVTWFKYEKVEYVTKTGKITKNLDIVKKQTPPKELVEHLLSVLENYPYHLFTARWQRKQWKNLSECLPDDHCMVEMDFSENYTATYQEEIQSLHWAKTQMTIHSMVVTRPTVPMDGVDESHVKEHWLLISNDLSHDFNFVNHSVQCILMKELQNLGCKVTVMHQRTDGCSSQYKSFNCFGDISRSEMDLGVKVIRNYSGSGHGKGEVDAAAGFLKTEARKTVVRDIDKAIHSAKDLFDFANDCLNNSIIGKRSHLHGRRYFYVDQSDINSDRNRAHFVTIKGTQKLHSVASNNAEGKVLTRLLSCSCIHCIAFNFSQCENKDYVEPFKLVSFSHNADEDKTEADDTDVSYSTTMYDMICQDSIVAVRPNVESLSDYFLFHVTSDGVTCLQDNISCQGHTYVKGTNVLHGYFYEYVKSNKKGCIYKKSNHGSDLVIPTDCILYVGIDMTHENNTFVLQIQDHEDIMCSIAI